MPKRFTSKKKPYYKKAYNYATNSSARGDAARRKYYVANISRPMHSTINIFKITIPNSSGTPWKIVSASGGIIADQWQLGGSTLSSAGDWTGVSNLYDMFRLVAAEVTFYPASQATTEATQNYAPLPIYYDPDSVGTVGSPQSAFEYENKKIWDLRTKQTFKTRIPKFDAFSSAQSLTTAGPTVTEGGFADIASPPIFGIIGWYGNLYTGSNTYGYMTLTVIIECKDRR